MQALFLTEAANIRSSPWTTRLSRVNSPKPEPDRRENRIHLHGCERGIPFGNAPGILDKDGTITAQVTIPKGGAEGMIVTEGGRFGGYGLFLRKASRSLPTICLIWGVIPLGGRHRW